MHFPGNIASAKASVIFRFGSISLVVSLASVHTQYAVRSRKLKKSLAMRLLGAMLFYMAWDCHLFFLFCLVNRKIHLNFEYSLSAQHYVAPKKQVSLLLFLQRIIKLCHILPEKCSWYILSGGTNYDLDFEFKNCEFERPWIYKSFHELNTAGRLGLWLWLLSC